ncbi:SusD/RagB family nutrient-binding outer membrane lipoprotein [Persicitalea jodogahamensis]|uniref:SusD/RagB family nutrient-binding outer membrane lipoprotein n=1 Tax=Persicitalea jodogahamensis TaxID=402147 RepID=A0A8J3DD72_9BACT|nr:SusD/RagB family nutrient-binding outer membrane lipoprotein [Persicitalea jodogahamensis]GHB85864.1 hypothetical protein GCM10007390_46760 [Persicitalea jodogahamensis]
MKKHIKTTVLALLSVLTLNSCDNEKLLDLNVNKNASTDIDQRYLLSLGMLQVAGDRYESWRTNLIYSSTMIQHNATLAGYWSGDKYYYNAQYSGAFWEANYPGSIKTLTQVVDQTKGKPESANTFAAASIMRSFVLHRMTDIYGDIPYTQAGRGLVGAENWFPKYDAQKDVYTMLVADIKTARDAFSPSARALGDQDVLYKGDYDKWRKFANSLLMRIALRMSNVDAATAKTVFTEAASKGGIDSNASNAFMKQVLGTGGGINYNGTSLALSNAAGGGGDNNARVSKTLVDFMDKYNDPRKMIIIGGLGNPYDKSTWVTDPAKQRGLPNGYTATTIKNVYPDFTTLDNFSFINTNITDLDDPTPLLSYAETELMLAEAALKGWVADDATIHFRKGVEGAIRSWAAYGVEVPSDAVITKYINDLGFAAAGSERKLELIGEQYWIATYLNHIEAWANWRRTGYPKLTPTNDPANVTGGTIPRRLRYYEDEVGSNPASYKEAIARQGEDLLTTRVWWDVKK